MTIRQGSVLPLRTLALLVSDTSIVLGEKLRGFGKGKFNGFGGKLEAGETIEQAMIRETVEECDCTPEQYTKVAIIDFYFPNRQENSQQVHVYLVSKWRGQHKLTDEMDPMGFYKTKIPYDRMWVDDQVWLPLVLRGKRLYGEFVFDHDGMDLARFEIKTLAKDEEFTDA